MTHYDSECKFCGDFGFFVEENCNCSGAKNHKEEIKKQNLKRKEEAFSILEKFGIKHYGYEKISIYDVAKVLENFQSVDKKIIEEYLNNKYN